MLLHSAILHSYKQSLCTLKIFFNLLFIFQKEKEEEVVKRHFYSQLLILSKF